jgi:hypothetical protein
VFIAKQTEKVLRYMWIKQGTDVDTSPWGLFDCDRGNEEIVRWQDVFINIDFGKEAAPGSRIALQYEES